VISNGVDTDFFVPNKSYHNGPYVLWVGRLIYAKGVFDLVKCAEYVCREHPSVSFLIAGEGPLMNQLRRLLKSRGLEKRVVLLGQLDRAALLRYYQNCALFLLTSHVESFPNTVLEAMSCGVPVVATKVGEVPKVVKDGETGFLVCSKDYKAIARRIIDLLNDKGLRRRIGEAARRLVENEYSWDSISDKILDCYKLII
jgi:glycosyltransferase involved in cell wall biosynthesis